MFDQLFGAILFFFNMLGSVRGESTPSASIATSSAVATDIPTLKKNFETVQTQALTSWEVKRASFAATLTGIKNEKKQTTLETLQNRLQEINKTQTILLMGKLKRLHWAILRIQTLTASYGTDSGKDVSKIMTMITTAEKAIAEAMAAVTLQAEKTYVMTITTESTAKKAFVEQRKLLADDLKKVRDLVKTARKKVGDALKALNDATGTTATIVVPEEDAL